MSPFLEVNLRLRLLWKQVIDGKAWPSTLGKPFRPHQYRDDYPTPALVFVGLNPSLTELELQTTGEKPINEGNMDAVLAGEPRHCHAEGALPESHYFADFGKFTHGTSLENRWLPVEMFAVRHTNQSAVVKALGIDREWPDFTLQQFAIFYDLLCALRPPVVVVLNALASRIISEQPWFRAGGQEERCSYADLAGRDTPVFLSGTIKYLDEDNKQHLIWHVRQAIEAVMSDGWEAPR